MGATGAGADGVSQMKQGGTKSCAAAAKTDLGRGSDTLFDLSDHHFTEVSGLIKATSK